MKYVSSIATLLELRALCDMLIPIESLDTHAVLPLPSQRQSTEQVAVTHVCALCLGKPTASFQILFLSVRVQASPSFLRVSSSLAQSLSLAICVTPCMAPEVM